MDLKTFIEDAATIFTIAVFLSGIEICRKIWRKKSTKDISPFPFLCGLISSSFWLRYGLLIEDSVFVLVNSCGVTLQILYICWFYRYNVSDSFSMQLLVTMMIVTFFYIFTTFCVVPENARYVAGLAACTAGVLFMASPLATVAHVFETKSVESLPFPMIVCTFLTTTLWFLYGLLTDDTFVQIPNFLGALLTFCQLCLFVIYPSRSKPYDITLIA